MTYLQHLEELRKRILFAILGVLGTTVFSFIFADKLFRILVSPLLQAMPEGNKKLIFTNLPEAFIAYLKVALVSGVFIASPFVLYQIWKFISPGLYEHEKRYAFPFVFFSSFFFVLGGFFCFTEVFPLGFKFFLSFTNDYIEALPKMSEYISFSLKLLLVFGLIFQLPILIYFLAKIGVVNSNMLRKNRKYAILIVFIVAAILTPPDVITQLMLALPLIILFELSIIIAKVVDRNREKMRMKNVAKAKEEKDTKP